MAAEPKVSILAKLTNAANLTTSQALHAILLDICHSTLHPKLLIHVHSCHVKMMIRQRVNQLLKKCPFRPKRGSQYRNEALSSRLT